MRTSETQKHKAQHCLCLSSSSQKLSPGLGAWLSDKMLTWLMRTWTSSLGTYMWWWWVGWTHTCTYTYTHTLMLPPPFRQLPSCTPFVSLHLELLYCLHSPSRSWPPLPITTAHPHCSTLAGTLSEDYPGTRHACSRRIWCPLPAGNSPAPPLGFMSLHAPTGPWWGLDIGMVLAPGEKVKPSSGRQAGPRCEHATGLSPSLSDSCLPLETLQSPSAGKGTRLRSVVKYLLQDSSGDYRLTFQRACPGITPDTSSLLPGESH